MKIPNSLSVTAAVFAVALGGVFSSGQAAADEPSSISGDKPPVTVYKSASCGCCKEWVSYLQQHGYTVKAINTDNLNEVKAKHGLTDQALKSCHTAIVDGYVIEGHVPVNDIERLLRERPRAVGLSAPGMPLMSPGMHSLVPKDYDVLLFGEGGEKRVFSSY